jgi:rod shape-determining protein MreC
MQNLIYLFIRYGGFILFLFLEGVSFYFVVQYNQKQKEIYVSSANSWVGIVYDKYDRVARFWNLSSVNDSLAKENASLRAQIRNAQFEATIRRDTNSIKKDSFIQQYTFQEAVIINNSINQANNYLTINRGSNSGLKYGMGVISSNGIVGIIRSISPNFSLVMSILHNQTKISAAVSSNNYFGSLVWKGADPRYMNLDAIPKHATVHIGDTVQTSGYSNIFPKGLPIGLVEKVNEKTGSGFLNINVRLFNDLSNLKYVYVVENIFDEEQKKLDQSLK